MESLLIFRFSGISFFIKTKSDGLIRLCYYNIIQDKPIFNTILLYVKPLKNTNWLVLLVIVY